MDPLTLPLAVIGITQFVKLAVREVTGYEIRSAYTIVVAVVAAALLSFVDLNSEIIQNIYQAIVAVGGLTGASMIVSAYRK